MGDQGRFTTGMWPLSSPLEHSRQAMAVQRPWGKRNGYQDREVPAPVDWSPTV